MVDFLAAVSEGEAEAVGKIKYKVKNLINKTNLPPYENYGGKSI